MGMGSPNLGPIAAQLDRAIKDGTPVAIGVRSRILYEFKRVSFYEKPKKDWGMWSIEGELASEVPGVFGNEKSVRITLDLTGGFRSDSVVIYTKSSVENHS